MKGLLDAIGICLIILTIITCMDYCSPIRSDKKSLPQYIMGK